ncbi:MAG TPA: glycoside hydrolase family 15 protein [Actinomycetota bacterium]|nr:glycoside hydrolase family 15 protein [Actinomycetota bacterium]
MTPRRTAPTSGAAEAFPCAQPPIGDYALISDCHTAALLSRPASVDWCCLPRYDSSAVFGRLLDWEGGGFWSIEVDGASATRDYLEDTLVLATTFSAPGGECRLLDCFTMRRGGRQHPHRQLLRVVEGVRGRTELRTLIRPRFDYGQLKPWVRNHGSNLFTAVGGDAALVIGGDAPLEPAGDHDLTGTFTVEAGERVRLSLVYLHPEDIDPEPPAAPDPDELDRRLDETEKWWRAWSRELDIADPYRPEVVRSALVLKGLVHAPTGAVVAAPTTSLPEALGRGRNWDYRFSWIRDSQFTVRSLAEVGADSEADGCRRFVERSAAGSAESLQIIYGAGGERSLQEFKLDLPGYCGSAPVRVGNAASKQLQLDAFGYLLEMAWRWHERGRSPDDDYWRFLLGLVDRAIEQWQEPDCGIWEMRGRPQHFVHSKVMCWAAVDRGIRLAEACLRKAPLARWRKAERAIRRAVEHDGYHRKRGVFVQAFASEELDAALLLIPAFDFLPYRDERIIRTTDAIRAELCEDGLVRRYRAADRLAGKEGTFLACTFWLSECLANQGRVHDALEVFARANSCATDLGLFSEEFDPKSAQLLGNFPQGLTHLSHIAAAVALSKTLPESG